jgi:hypothetical protein
MIVFLSSPLPSPTAFALESLRELEAAGEARLAK